MSSVLSMHYRVTGKTMAMIPSALRSFQMTAYETDRLVYVKKSQSLTLIKYACMKWRSLPLDKHGQENIYAFQPHALPTAESVWIFSKHVKSVKPMKQIPTHSLITFHNDQILKVDVPYRDILYRMQRNSFYIALFTFD
ncbi:competence protein ComK [Halalkalibacter suaedae]|uniref:Competence protein ComK n=1 Tax=Halalkalibacter suaedae TaxID=2822140 RepID=A0A940WVB3_9BACI|nr:competence protein ComK [Bacillus suaedae]MBP3953075.1 competence protein ComK [Bacillus suaedae]